MIHYHSNTLCRRISDAFADGRVSKGTYVFTAQKMQVIFPQLITYGFIEIKKREVN